MNKLQTLLIVVLLMFGSACTRIGPGYVGIKVNQAGSDRGVEDYPIQMGWVWYNPLTSDVYEYPIYTHTVSWDNDSQIQFNAKGGTRVTAPVSISFNFKADRVPHVFVTYRTTPEVIEEGYLKNQVRDAFNRAGNTFEPLELLTNQQALLDLAKKNLEEHIGSNFSIESLILPRGLHLPENITNSINQVIEAQQRAQKVQAEVAAVEAEGRKVITAAEAQATANRKITESLSPALVELRKIEKWDGHLPQVAGSGTPIINMTK